MSSFNRVIIMGNVTRDIELRYTPGGKAVCDLGIAVNDRKKDASGQWVDETTFVDVTLFERQAEVAAEYLAKGSSVLIEGKLKLEQWTDRESGQRRQKLKVIGDRMQMVGAKREGGGGGAGGSQRREAAPAASEQGEGGEDIPF